MIENQREQPKIAKLLSRTKFARVYLLNALDTGSEKVFLDGLHNIMDAIIEELEVDLIEDYTLTLLDYIK